MIESSVLHQTASNAYIGFYIPQMPNSALLNSGTVEIGLPGLLGNTSHQSARTKKASCAQLLYLAHSPMYCRQWLYQCTKILNF